MQKTVSICCITYNHRNYIRRCLDNLVNQAADFEYEIVAHDDASTDETQDIVRKYAEKHPDLIVPAPETESQYSKGMGALASAMQMRLREIDLGRSDIRAKEPERRSF